ncbi:hypothetical protein QBC38DRAFT_467512 [Podospora fimiseda]|uniref:Splicing factor U2AF subunit n=1 Tax=Podospora fimiseda TaxID=252190 RepID=A0AAN7BX25_9PEZI|nr:hypothetical protein QBC38DRAFT_467512 [Podospora fimiseda]
MNGDAYSSRDSGRHGSSRDHPGGSRRDRDDRRDRGGGRRRSRSPDYRSGGAGGGGGGGGGGGRSRRDEGGDVDAYSSSRSHRDREREDRYSGRDRRGGERERGGGGGGDRDRGGDREWDRDRGAGRSRRDDDERRDRRPDRDAEERRRRERVAEREQERRRSASPVPKKREPTPDLTDIVSVLHRKRRLTQWDIKPPGYDNVTAEQAKLSGMFPLPGAPRQQAMDPVKLQAFVQSGGSANTTALKPTNSRQARRLIISQIPPSATEESIVSFFNLQLNGLNVIENPDPCLLCHISSDRSFAMLEFRTNTDATIALAFDGISMEADDHGLNGNQAAYGGLKIRRPKDYIVPAIVEDPNYDPDSLIPSRNVIDSPNKISIANIPLYLTDDQIIELLVSFGRLKSFVLVKDRHTNESRGIAFLEYYDSSVTDVAISGLDNMTLGEKALKVRKASIGITQVAGEMGVNAMSMLAGTTSVEGGASRVLQLLNMVTADELIDKDDYEEIRDDVQEECEKYGKILSLKIPRPSGGSKQSAGVGKIYVKYETADSASKALKALAGRKFADRTVVTTFFPEENFDVDAW